MSREGTTGYEKLRAPAGPSCGLPPVAQASPPASAAELAGGREKGVQIGAILWVAIGCWCKEFSWFCYFPEKRRFYEKEYL